MRSNSLLKEKVIVIPVQWVIYMVVVCCALFVALFFLYSFLAKKTAKHEEDEVVVNGKGIND